MAPSILPGLSCLVESKNWGKNVAIGPIDKMRSQLMRRPAGTIGLMLSKKTFTKPAIYLAHFTVRKRAWNSPWKAYSEPRATALYRHLRITVMLRPLIDRAG
jgi:hypothetical protein